MRVQRMASNSDRKVVIVGKTGNGKSSLGNTLLGRKSFAEGDGFDAETLTSQLEQNVGGLAVVDTPGLFDTKDTAQKVVKGALAIVKALDLCPGPHAFLVVFNGACRLTEEEMSVIDILRISFGNEWIKHAIVVITHIDNDVEDCKFENKWKKCENLRKLVEECGGRVARINNKNPRKEHIEKITREIEHVSNNGKVSYKYSYIECHKEVLSSAAELEKYNGMPTHQLVLQLTRSIDDKVQKEIKRQEDIALAIRRNNKEERELLKAKKKQSRKKRKKKSALGSAAAGVFTAATTAGITAAAAVSVPLIIGASLSSGGIVGVLTFGVLFYNYVRE